MQIVRAYLVPCAALLLLAGCGFKPEEAVTVKVSGISGDAQKDQIETDLKEGIEGSSSSTSFMTFNDEMTATLAPVRDLEKFAEGIEFGKVTSIDKESRTITVQIE